MIVVDPEDEISKEEVRVNTRAAPIGTSSVGIDKDSVGERWVSQDDEQIAAYVAIVAMGQAAHAANILSELSPASPSFTTSDLRDEAVIKLSVQEKKQTPRVGYPRYQRDGFIFEVISWIAARLTYGDLSRIEQHAVIERILGHLGHTAVPVDPAHPSRAPPQGDCLV